jgi:S1-C subfamily serine protease
MQVPPGCSRYDVELRRPLGLVLEERKTGEIIVAEVQPGGHAEKLGSINTGDILISTSAYIYTRESKYGEATVKSGEQRVILNTRSEVSSFE